MDCGRTVMAHPSSGQTLDAMHSNDTILVIGGTGKTGRRVAERLTARGVPVRIGSRRSQPAFDWDDPATWPAAIEGTTAAYVAFAPDLALPGAAAAVREVARLASDAGLRRLVLLSGRGEEEALRAEAEARSAFPGVTVLRCSFFAQNFTEGAFAPDVQAGELALPVGDVREPFIDADDIADAAVAALLEDGHEGELYELTGPRLLTFGRRSATPRACGASRWPSSPPGWRPSGSARPRSPSWSTSSARCWTAATPR